MCLFHSMGTNYARPEISDAGADGLGDQAMAFLLGWTTAGVRSASGTGRTSEDPGCGLEEVGRLQGCGGTSFVAAAPLGLHKRGGVVGFSIFNFSDEKAEERNFSFWTRIVMDTYVYTLISWDLLWNERLVGCFRPDPHFWNDGCAEFRPRQPIHDGRFHGIYFREAVRQQFLDGFAHRTVGGWG